MQSLLELWMVGLESWAAYENYEDDIPEESEDEDDRAYTPTMVTKQPDENNDNSERAAELYEKSLVAWKYHVDTIADKYSVGGLTLCQDAYLPMDQIEPKYYNWVTSPVEGVSDARCRCKTGGLYNVG